MSSIGALTGRSGKFSVGTEVARTTQWAVSPKLASTSEWGDSDSGGYTNRAPGRRDATFTAEGKFDFVTQVFVLFEPGDYAAATLWLTTPDPLAMPPVPSLYYSFPRALNTEFSLTVNIDSEEVIGWTSSWGADGFYYAPGDAGAPSANL